LIGSLIGTFEGCMPGAGGSVAAFMSYNEAKRWSRRPEEFGKGSAEGIAAPEAANNTVACTALVPTLTFGIPGSNSTAVLLGGLLIHGLQPGPLLFTREPEFIYGLYGGLAVANVVQIPLGILIMTPCLWLVSRPKPYLLAGIYALVFSGVYSINHSLFDLWIVLAAGVLGYGLRYFGFPFLPLVLGLILGHMIEASYRRSLVLSSGDHSIFIQDPVSAGLLAAAVLLVIASIARNWYGARKATRPQEEAG
jgi:putative tricarboxylic transport membrane protein